MNIFKTVAIMFFDLIDKYLHQKRILKGLKNNIAEINFIMDIGSHKGLYTDLFFKSFNAKKIYLFEPQKKIFKYIKAKYKKNKKIETFNLAASNKELNQRLYINKHDLTSSLNKINKKNNYLNYKAKIFGGNINKMINESYSVKSIKLSNFIKRKKIKKIDLIKIDTEGHEFEVLTGIGRKIRDIRVILIEFHNDDVYLKYNSKKIHKYIIKNHFYLKEVIKFPFTTWEDRVYINKRNTKLN